jgi:hypothetical protein
MPIADSDSAAIVRPTADSNPNAPVPVTNVTITEPSYADVIVDTKWTPVSSIVTHVSGALWNVNYYSQVIDTDSQLMSQATSVSGVYQQYKLIKGLNLRVVTPLTQVQDPDTKMMQSDGAAIVYGNIIPNEGDMFTADIGMSETAIFRVSSSKKNSIFKEATYEIEYALSNVSDHHVEDLDAKVVQEYVWKEDFLNRGLDPVIIEEEANSLAQLGAAYEQLCAFYFPLFFNHEYKTFTIPLQEYTTYDPFLTQFIADNFDNSDHLLLQDLRVLNVGSDKPCKQSNIWTAITLQDIKKINSGFTRNNFVWVSQFDLNPMFNGIRWSGITQCVYPTNPRIGYAGLTTYQVLAPNGSAYNGITPTTFYNTQENTEITDPQAALNRLYPPANIASTITTLNADGTVDFNGVGVDDYYVLSENFYLQNTSQTYLELFVSSYLKKEAPDIDQLVKTAEIAPNWGVLEQYYYIPILLIVMRSAINNYQG